MSTELICGMSCEDPLIKATYEATQYISRYFDVTLHGTDKIPASGVMLVGNHALMGVDTWAMLPALTKKIRRVPRGMGLRSLFYMPVVGAALRELGMVPGTRQSAIALLKSDEMVLTYPGGAKDSLKGRNKRYKLQWDGRTGFAVSALKAQRPIVPFAGIGVDECFPIFGKEGLIPAKWLGSSSLKVPLFLPVMRRIPFSFHFGEPITPPAYDEGWSPERVREAAHDYASDVWRANQALLDTKLEERGDLGLWW